MGSRGVTQGEPDAACTRQPLAEGSADIAAAIIDTPRSSVRSDTFPPSVRTRIECHPIDRDLTHRKRLAEERRGLMGERHTRGAGGGGDAAGERSVEGRSSVLVDHHRERQIGDREPFEAGAVSE